MLRIPWSHTARATRTLSRGIAGFTATLPSGYPGISFTSRFAAAAPGAAESGHDPILLAAAIRLVLRKAAGDAALHVNPADLAEAVDICNQRLATPLPVPAYLGVHVTATVKLNLSHENQQALNDFIDARRKQGIQDLLQRQHASAIRDYFTDPALILSWWLDQAAGNINNLPKAEELRAIAKTFKDYPKVADHPIEYQVLDLIRAFIAEFPEQHQKKALLALLGNGFQRAGLDQLAREVESLSTDEKFNSFDEATVNPSLCFPIIRLLLSCQTVAACPPA